MRSAFQAVWAGTAAAVLVFAYGTIGEAQEAAVYGLKSEAVLDQELGIFSEDSAGALKSEKTPGAQLWDIQRDQTARSLERFETDELDLRLPDTLLSGMGIFTGNSGTPDDEPPGDSGGAPAMPNLPG